MCPKGKKTRQKLGRLAASTSKSQPAIKSAICTSFVNQRVDGGIVPPWLNVSSLLFAAAVIPFMINSRSVILIGEGAGKEVRIEYVLLYVYVGNSRKRALHGIPDRTFLSTEGNLAPWSRDKEMIYGAFPPSVRPLARMSTPSRLVRGWG